MLLPKHLPSHRSKTMHITAYTPRGIFKSENEPYDETIYKGYNKVLEEIDTMKYFGIDTVDGHIHMNKQMIDQSVFTVTK